MSRLHRIPMATTVVSERTMSDAVTSATAASARAIGPRIRTRVIDQFESASGSSGPITAGTSVEPTTNAATSKLPSTSGCEIAGMVTVAHRRSRRAPRLRAAASLRARSSVRDAWVIKMRNGTSFNTYTRIRPRPNPSRTIGSSRPMRSNRPPGPNQTTSTDAATR